MPDGICTIDRSESTPRSTADSERARRGPAHGLAAHRRLLGMLRRDGRAPVEDLARHVGASPSTVRRRLADLRAAGTLFFDVDFDHGMLDARARTMLWLTVAPAELDTVGRALAGHPEVPVRRRGHRSQQPPRQRVDPEPRRVLPRT